MSSQPKNIAIAGLLSEKNFGDIIIFDCTRHLVTSRLAGTPNTGVLNISFQGPIERPAAGAFAFGGTYAATKVAKSLLPLGRYMYTPAIKALSAYYGCQLADASAVIVAGGGLIKYRHQNLWLYLSALIQAAENLRLPVFLNAIGVEGYDPNNRKCEILREAVNKPVVRAITTRDDIATLVTSYLLPGSGVHCSETADPAVWASDVYNIDRDRSSNVIGIGLTRGGIFEDHGRQVSNAQVVACYADVLTELDRRGFRWTAFTNGYPQDTELASQIFARCKYLGRSPPVLVPRQPEGLVRIIAGFKAVIAARLHANIISYSLGIPSVGLVWNDKLTFYGKAIGYPERFIQAHDFNGKLIVNRLEGALVEGYARAPRDAYRTTAIEGVTRLVDEALQTPR